MDYARYQKIARDQIRKYGQLVTFNLATGPATYDPISGQMSQEVLEAETYAVLASPSMKALSTKTIKIGDAVLLIDGRTLPQAPCEEDTVMVGGVEWRVVAVSSVAPSGLVIIYKIFIRKS